MDKRRLAVVTIMAMATMLFSVAIYAGTEVKDEIKMENPAYETREYQPVTFTHKKHSQEYKLSCGECHHDEDNKPLDLKEGDEVKNCIECHKKPGYVTGKDAKGLTKEQKHEYHANAVMDNCRDCHRKFNKDKGYKTKDEKAAPTTCKKCHGGKLK